MSLFKFENLLSQEEKTFNSWVTNLANKVSLKLQLERGLSSSIVEYTEFVEMKDGSWGYQCPDLKQNVD